jgi:hypothetical protein
MCETQAIPPLAIDRDTVTAAMDAGEPFSVVEEAINESVDLTENAKAALWLLAFSLRDQTEQLRDARAHLDAIA